MQVISLQSGSTTNDSERTMLRLETARVLMVVISFMGSQGLDGAVQRAAVLLERYPTTVPTFN